MPVLIVEDPVASPSPCPADEFACSLENRQFNITIMISISYALADVVFLCVAKERVISI